MKQECEIITKFYRSNCVIEALKAKLRNPKIKMYVCAPYIKPSGSIGSMHIIWSDEQYSYDFSDENWDDSGKFWEYFIYRGCIRRWPRSFAKDFAAKRNRTAFRSWKKLLKKLVRKKSREDALYIDICGPHRRR